MQPRSLVSALSLLPCALLLTACAVSSPQLYKPLVDASLLLPCKDPVLAPDNPSDNELGAERLRVAKAYVDCRDKDNALIGRVNQPLAEPMKKGWLGF